MIDKRKRKGNFFAMAAGTDIGIDLGTASVLVYVKGKELY